jgi:TonB family protein
VVLGAALAAPASGQGTGSAQPPGLSIDQIRRNIGAARPDSNRTDDSIDQSAIRLVPARAVRVPGARFALGDSLEHLVQRLGLSPDGSAATGPDERVFTGAIEYFGQMARGRFTFQGRWLARAEIETDAVSERVRDYILDEYQRQGYRRTCRTIAARKLDCRWTGRTIVEMEIDTSGVHADVTLPDHAMVPVTEVPPLLAADGIDLDEPVPSDIETLGVAGVRGRREAIVESRVAPVFGLWGGEDEPGPAGKVLVLARVDAGGAVQEAQVLRSDDGRLVAPALEAVRKWRFKPHNRNGRPVSFWVEIPLSRP